MEIMNLTPHSITFMVGDTKLVIEPSGSVARVSATTEVVGEVKVGDLTIPITSTVFGQVEGLPDQTDDTIFIVSSLVAGRVPDRKDVFIPNESIRDDKGRIIGCLSLGKI